MVLISTLTWENRRVPSPTPADLAWRRSSYCANGACVEIAYAADGEYLLRDGKNPNDGTLTFTQAGWRYLLGELKAGKFDG